MKKVSILGYHKIGEPSFKDWHTWNYVSAESFDRQLEYLHKNNWSVIGIDTFLAGMDNPEIIPDKAVLLTFDDGYKSMLEIALPILKKYSCPAVLFVPTGFVGG